MDDENSESADKRSKNFDNRPNRRQKNSAPQPRLWQSSRQRVVTMMTQAQNFLATMWRFIKIIYK